MKAVLPRSVRSTAKNWRSGYKKGASRYWKGPCGSIVIYEVFIKELNHVSWDGREPVYDIRTWNVDHSEYGKGVTLTSKELACLREALLAMQ